MSVSIFRKGCKAYIERTLPVHLCSDWLRPVVGLRWAPLCKLVSKYLRVMRKGMPRSTIKETTSAGQKSGESGPW
eukprot:jgi/Mesvir1/1305/Mv26167-RA.1